MHLILAECGYKNPDNVRMSKLNDKLVRQFFLHRLKGLADGTVEKKRAIITANSAYKKAKSIFSKRQLDGGVYADLNLGNIEDFLSVPLLIESPVQYEWIGNEEFGKVLRDSEYVRDGDPCWITSEKREADPALYCAFLLCYATGIRRNEAIHARWDWIKRDRQGNWILHVPGCEEQRGKIFRTKNDKGRDIPMADAVYRELQALSLTGDCPEHIIPTKSHWEREIKVWERFSAWFRSLGINRLKAAHECRKFFGAQVATHQGLYAACKLLGHSSIQITEKYYADYVDPPVVPKIRLPKLKEGCEVIIVEVLGEEESPSSPSTL